jgi:autotransporter-associated beta strand protein
VSWTSVKTNTLTDFGTTLYAGFFTYAGPSANPSVHWASFNNVSLVGNLVGPPGVTVIPQTDTAYTGQTVVFTAVPSGNAPFTYQWQYNNTNIPGATNATLSLTNVQPSASGLYTVGLSNSNGTASATATLTVLSPSPTVAQVLSNNPTGYWRLSEAAGPTAYDSAGSYNGTGEGGLVFGVPGVSTAPFTGFESGNLAAQFNGTDSDVSIPGMNFTTANFTITGWAKCNGVQTSWSGLVFSRSSGFGTGLMVANNGSNVELRYSWNDNGGDYNFSTGLNLPTNGQWAFVALTIEPTRAIVYLATNSVLKSATNSVTDNSRTFNGSFYFGYDPNSGARRINGALDEIAVYNRTLTPTQISQILAASQQTAPAVSLSSPASGAGYAAPASIGLSASVTTNGHAINYVAFYNGASLLGISSNSPYAFTWTNVAAGAYTVYAQLVYDSASTVSSAPAFITVNSIPAAPATVTPTALATNLVNVGWSASTYATSYILSRNGTAIATLSGTNYLDLGLVANSNYCYSVVAASTYGSSSSSTTNCVTTPATGGAYEWDAGGGASGPQDGNGAWGNGATTWWNGSANVAWANNNLAVFGAGTATNCTAIITNDVTVAGILFNANNGGNYDLSSSANGASRLNFAAATTITANNDATIDALLMGNGQIIKTGPGTLTLKAANTNTGPVIVKAGRLVATVSPWYTPRSIGSGALTVSNGAVAQFTGSH